MKKKIKSMHPDIEDQIISLREKANRAALKFHNEESALRKKLKNCGHKHVEPMEWEWDDGYGQQKRIIGERCLCCLKQRGWAGVGSWNKAEDDDDLT